MVLPVEQFLIGQEVVQPRDVDQSEAEHGGVGVGSEDASDSSREGHGKVSCYLHQTAGHTHTRWNRRVKKVTLQTSMFVGQTDRLCCPPLK